MPVEIKVDIKGMDDLRAFIGGYRKQLPFTMSQALNKTAFDVRQAEQSEIDRAFDSPVSFVKRSPKVEKSTKRKMQSSVYIDPRVQRSLIAQVEGGPRLPRDITRKMYGMGTLRPGDYTTYNPAYTNRSGNLTYARWKRIVAALRQNRGQYFVATIGGLKAIWIRKGRGGKQIAPVVFITRNRPKYQPRFDFYGVAIRKYDVVFGKNFDAALAKAMRTAR